MLVVKHVDRVFVHHERTCRLGLSVGKIFHEFLGADPFDVLSFALVPSVQLFKLFAPDVG